MTESNEICKSIVAIRETKDSEKHSKFVDRASKRTSNVLHGMDVLQKCFDKYTYDYSEIETTKIFNAIEARVTQLRSAAERGSSRSCFTL